MSDALARPAYFSLRERYTRVDCLEPNYEGLWADVRTNLTNGERVAFVEAVEQFKQDIRDRLERRIAQAQKFDDAVDKAKDDKARETAMTKRREFVATFGGTESEIRTARMELVAPYVRAWNVVDDDLNDVPSPKAGGVASFDFVDEVVLGWLESEIRDGYLGGKGIRTRAAASESLPEPTNEPQSANETEPAA